MDPTTTPEMETASDIQDALDSLVGALDDGTMADAIAALTRIRDEATDLLDQFTAEPDAEPDAHNPVISRGYPRSVAGYQQMAGIGGGR